MLGSEVPTAHLVSIKPLSYRTLLSIRFGFSLTHHCSLNSDHYSFHNLLAILEMFLKILQLRSHFISIWKLSLFSLFFAEIVLLNIQKPKTKKQIVNQMGLTRLSHQEDIRCSKIYHARYLMYTKSFYKILSKSILTSWGGSIEMLLSDRSSSARAARFFNPCTKPNMNPRTTVEDWTSGTYRGKYNICLSLRTWIELANWGIRSN